MYKGSRIILKIEDFMKNPELYEDLRIRTEDYMMNQGLHEGSWFVKFQGL